MSSIGRVPHLVSAALPAAGAWTAQQAFEIPQNITSLNVWITYTRGAAGGRPRLRPLFGDGVEEARDAFVETSATATTSADVAQAVFAHDIDGPAPADGNPVTFELPFEVPPGATTFRLLASEAGVTGSPGTLAIFLTGRGT